MNRRSKYAPTVRRFWTERERSLLARDYGRLPAEKIASALRRSLRQVYAQAASLGLCRHTRFDWTKLDADLLRLHAEGCTDGEIAQHLRKAHGRRVPRESVGYRRRAMGLVSNAFSERRRRAVAAKTREQLDRAGLTSMAELRAAAWAAAARRCGWPEDLRPRAVQILNALHQHGPMTRRQLADAAGMPWKGSRKSLVSNDPEGTYLSHLVRRGLVVRLPRLVKASADGSTGRGKTQHLYALALGVQPQRQRSDN